MISCTNGAAQGPMPVNTTLDYLYRDGSNYKQWGKFTFPGVITPEQEARFTEHLDDGEHFIAEQVGLPNLREEWSSHYEDDHVWHEFSEFRVTDFHPDTEETVGAFVDRFCSTEWDIVGASEGLDAWKEETPQGH